MALEDHDEAGAGEDDTKPGTKDAKKKHKDNMLIIGIALVGVILTYLIYRSNQQKNASATNTTSGYPSTGYVAGAGAGGTTNATDPFAEAAINQLNSQYQQQGAALSGLQSSLAALTAEVGSLSNTPTSSTPQSPSPVPASPGYGYINLPGIGQSVILGNLTSGGYTGYEVGGGAPVYFGNASGVSQGSGQETTGSYAYTPVAYAPLVGASPSSGGPLPGQH